MRKSGLFSTVKRRKGPHNDYGRRCFLSLLSSLAFAKRRDEGEGWPRKKEEACIRVSSAMGKQFMPAALGQQTLSPIGFRFSQETGQRLEVGGDPRSSWEGNCNSGKI